MNAYKHFFSISAAIFVFSIFFSNLSIAKPPEKSSKNEKSSKSISTQVLNFGATVIKLGDTVAKRINITTDTTVSNALYTSADAMLDNAVENKSYLLNNGRNAVKKLVKNSANVRKITRIAGGNVTKTLKVFAKTDTMITGVSFFGSLAGGDIVGAGESLLNASGSAASASAGGKLGATIGTFIAPGAGTVIGGFIGAFSGGIFYNEAIAPEVKKAGDFASIHIANGEVKIQNERLRIKRENKKNFDTVYPNGYTGSEKWDPITGMPYEKRPDFLSREASKIRKEQRLLQEKLNKEMGELTDKNKDIHSPDTKKDEKKPFFKGKQVVPNVKNKSLKKAFNILKNAGFILAPPEGGDPAPTKKLVGHVQLQVPAGGQSEYQDKPIILILYSDVEVPDVLEMTAENVIKKLKSAGFSMIPAGCDPPPTKELSFLSKIQVPAAKTPGKGHSSVKVTFYPEYKDPVVPSIINIALPEAAGILDKGGFSLSSDLFWGDRAVTRKQVGTIQQQQPAEGESMAPGGKVKVWIYYSVVPKVLTISKEDAESAMKAAWLVPNSVKGNAIEDKNKWGTIQSQSLEPEKKITETGLKVTLRVYQKPEKKKNQYMGLIGSWKGWYKRSSICLKIRSVDIKGNFIGNLVWLPKKHKTHTFPGGVTNVEGVINGTNIFFQEIKLIRGGYVLRGKQKWKCLWGIGKGRNKYIGTLNSNDMIIRGKYYILISSKKNKWSKPGPFSIKKQ